MIMRKLRTLAIAGGLTLAGAAVTTPALADVDFRFGINVGPPAYYYAPPPSYYYHGGPYYYYAPYY
jgi:hypothetical protein